MSSADWNSGSSSIFVSSTCALRSKTSCSGGASSSGWKSSGAKKEEGPSAVSMLHLRISKANYTKEFVLSYPCDSVEGLAGMDEFATSAGSGLSNSDKKAMMESQSHPARASKDVGPQI